MRFFSKHAQRFFALFLAALTFWLIWKMLLQWWLLDPFLRIGEEESVLQIAHQRYSVVAAQGPLIKSRLAESEQNVAPPGSLLNAKSPEEATAQVMQIIAERVLPASTHGLPCIVINRLPERPSQSGSLVRIRVQAELECGIQSLAATLYRLENNAPFLKVEAFEIRRLESGVAGQGRLSIRMQLSGLLVKPKAANP